jgi:hypothetical protein
MVTAPQATPEPRQTRAVVPSGGYSKRASDRVREMFAASSTPKSWHDLSVPDDYVLATVVSIGEEFVKSIGKKASSLTVRVEEGTQGGDPITHGTLLSIPLSYVDLQQLQELTPGTTFAVHYRGRQGWKRIFRIAVPRTERGDDGGTW